MKRWLPWFVAVLALAGWVFAGRSSSPDLLSDTDTSTLLHRLQEVRDPLSWLRGDWPLQNHFYRPVSTWTFEFDVWRSGGYSRAFSDEAAANHGATNAFLAALCVVLAFWLMREVTDSPVVSGLAALLFGAWHLGVDSVRWIGFLVSWAAPLCLLGVFRGGKEKVWPCVVAAVSCVFLATQLGPVESFAGRIVHWLPGRTASVMCVFALAGLALYARSLRGSRVVPMRAKSEDLPATKSVDRTQVSVLGSVLLVAFSGVLFALALMSYEQAVMLPTLAFGIWTLSRLRGYRAPWWPHVLFWGLLFAYLVVRSRLVPSDVSGYQAQQFRTGPGVWIVLGEYSAPFVYWTYSLAASFGGLILVFNAEFWPPVLAIVGNVTTLYASWRDHARWWVFGFLVLSFFAFLPMAWLHPFEHYHYLPSVFRAGYVVALSWVVLRLVVIAASPPALKAPPRRDPAPGSLLRP